MRWLLPVFVLSSAVALAPGCKSPYSACEDCGGEASGGAPGGQGGDVQSSGGSPDEGCDEGQIACGDSCIDPQTDPSHCGARGSCEGRDAGAVCADDERCEEGECVLDCPDGTLDCFGTCIDPLSDALYCGASGACQAEDDTWGEFCVDDDVCVSGTCRGWGEGERLAYEHAFGLPSGGKPSTAISDSGLAAIRAHYFYWQRGPGDETWVQDEASSYGSIALDGQGNGLLVVPPGQTVEFSTREPEDDAWSALSPLSSESALLALDVTVSQGFAPNASVLWLAYSDPTETYSQWSAYRNLEGEWSVPVQLAANSVPHLGALGIDGEHLAAAWTTSGNNEVRARVGLAGEWGESQRLSRADVAWAGAPMVRVDSAGNSLAAWTEFDGAETSLRVRAFRIDEGEWQSTLVAGESVSDEERTLQLEVTETGWGLITWRNAEEEMACAVFSPHSLELQSCSAPATASAPLLPVLAAGRADLSNALVAWAGDVGIWVSQFDSIAREFSPPVLLSKLPFEARFVSLEQDSFGRAFAAWVFHDEYGMGELWAARFE